MRSKLENKKQTQVVEVPLCASASACGKAIIVGEHAVIYGAKAIAIPLVDIRISVELRPVIRKGSNLSISFKVGEKEVSSHGCGVITDAFKILNISPFSLKLKGKSTLPIGAGLGSSASLSVVVLKAICKSCGLTLDKHTLSRHANQLEVRFHGNPSGLDTTVVAYEDCISFIKGNTPQPIPRGNSSKNKLSFAIIDSNIRASTLSMIKIAANFFYGSLGERRLARFDALADSTESSLALGDIIGLKEAMTEAHTLLLKTGIVTEPLQEIIDICHQKGVLAAKTTGAGGGGVILSLLDPARVEHQVAALKAVFGPAKVFTIRI